MHGAAGENRTHDPVLTKDVRYHYATAAAEASVQIQNNAILTAVAIVGDCSG